MESESTKDKLSTQAPQAILQLEKTGLSPALAVADCPGAKQMPINAEENAGLACVSALYFESSILLSETPRKQLSQDK